MSYLVKPLYFIVAFLLFLQLTGRSQFLQGFQIRSEADSFINERSQNIFNLQNGKSVPQDIILNGRKIGERNSKAGTKESTQRISSTSIQQKTNKGCFDTSARLVFKKDSVWMGASYITKTRDGNILIPGNEFNPSTNGFTSQLLKCTQDGDTIWSKIILGGYDKRLLSVYRAFELKDESILLVGNMDLPMPYHDREDLMIIRVSSSGNPIWEKTFKAKLWDSDTTIGNIDIYDCKQDADGNMYLCGGVKHGGPVVQALSFKIDLSGNVLWSRAFKTGINPLFIGINIVNQKVTFIGRNHDGNSIALNIFEITQEINTGDTLSTKGLSPSFRDDAHQIYVSSMIKLKTGNLMLYGYGMADSYTGDPTVPFTHYGLIEITPEFNFVNSYIFRSPNRSNGYNTIITAFDDGSAAYSRVNYISGYSADIIFGSFKNGQITKERVIPYRGIGASWTSNFVKMDDGGYLITNSFGDSIRSIDGIELLKLHNSDAASVCLGKDTLSTRVETVLSFNPYNLYFETIVADALSEDPRSFKGIFNNSFTITTNCKQVNYCDTLQLTSSRDTICANSTATIRIKKNKECLAVPLWTYDTTNVSFFTRIDDNTMQISFNKPWKGYIHATLDGCSVLKDSVLFTVLQSPSRLDLGPDTVICPGNTIELNARNGYVSYKWQDDSVDSTYKVTKPGKYFVTTTDACNGIFSDTVLVLSHPPITFDIGPDITICKNDTISASAPEGFLHYKWTNYNISSDTSKTVQIFPLESTLYKVTAEKTAGCFVSDSMYVTVKNVPEIELGNDTSFCTGQFIILDAGTGFDNYQWNTGAISQKITVSQLGIFSVSALVNGCSSKDTLQVLNVHPLPSFSLGKDTTLCEGQQMNYNFNLAEASYNWSTGSALPVQTINKPGTYWLQVTQQGCRNSDTIRVKYNPSPIINLGKDTTLCENSGLVLNAFNNNATYYWQDGSRAASYFVQKPGTYYVIADLNHCIASDTINIGYKSLPHFSLGKDTLLCQGEQLILKPVINTAVNYTWQNGSTTSSFTIQKEGIYILTASNECGSFTDSINITTGVCNIIMPSAFTPNGDGLNDVFKVKYPFLVKQFRMEVFNRWGQKVFESTNIKEGWNGKWKAEEAYSGIYVWIISFTDIDNKQHQLKGNVTLIK